jgi:hypothetical protein
MTSEADKNFRSLSLAGFINLEYFQLKSCLPLGIEHAGDRREGMNQAVMQDVASLFRGKSTEQLLELEACIKAKISRETGIDVDYWESLLGQLKVKARRHSQKNK